MARILERESLESFLLTSPLMFGFSGRNLKGERLVEFAVNNNMTIDYKRMYSPRS